jgi:hydrogenase maturation protein HypF
MALAYLHAAGLPHAEAPAAVRAACDAPGGERWARVAPVAGSSAAPLSTSAGRHFDAVASLLGVAQESSFEGEAAMRLEALAATAGASAAGAAAPLPVDVHGDPLVIDTVCLVRRIAAESARGRPAAELAAVFHESVARAVVAACAELAARHGVQRVALSGGVFQNALLLDRTAALLGERGVEVHANAAVPCNDGGISLGQALVAASSRVAAGRSTP